MAADVITPACQSSSHAPPRSPRSSRPLVYITRRIPQKGVETLLGACDLKHWDSEESVPRGEMLYSVRGAHAILCLPSDCVDADVLDAAGPSLRVIATLSCDSRHIDTVECARRGVAVITVPLQPQESFAQLTVALMLLTIKETLPESEKLSTLTLPMPDLLQASSENVPCNWTNRHPRLLRRQSTENLAFQWSNGRPTNTQCDTWDNIAKKTIGVFGLNKLGQSVIQTLKTFGFKTVLATNLEVGLDNCDIVNKSELDFDIVDFEEFLARSEVICVCGSAGESFDTVFNKEAFKKMQNNAILITSQSEETSVCYVDLYVALRDGQIRAAGLNDCNQEPAPFKIPLSGLQNCVFLPQTSESVYDMRHEVSYLIAKTLIETLNSTRKRIDSISE